MSEQNKIEISMDDLLSSWKEIAVNKDEELAMVSAALKSYERKYQQMLSAKEEEIYELTLTIRELKGENVEVEEEPV